MLQKVNLSNVVTIGFGSFASTSLSGDHQLDKLLSVGDYAFQNTYLTTFNAPNLRKLELLLLKIINY
ncbi:MAG: hypothetical protein ACLU5J_04225 [Christensenellales bacterium]